MNQVPSQHTDPTSIDAACKCVCFCACECSCSNCDCGGLAISVVTSVAFSAMIGPDDTRSGVAGPNRYPAGSTARSAYAISIGDTSSYTV